MSSKRAIRRRTCQNKITHATQIAASFHLARLKLIKPGDRFSCYKCKFCHNFHVGHTPYSIRARLRN